MTFEEAVRILAIPEVQKYILMLTHHFRDVTPASRFQAKMINSLRDAPDVQQALQVVWHRYAWFVIDPAVVFGSPELGDSGNQN